MNQNTNYDILFNKDSSEKVNRIIRSYYLEGGSEPMSYIPNTNLINIIIGSNNSGKSRFMRYLMQCKSLIGVKNIEYVNKVVAEYNAAVEQFNHDKIEKPLIKYQSMGHRYYNLSSIDETKEKHDFLGKNKLVALRASDYLDLYPQLQSNIERLARLKDIGVSDNYFEEFSSIDKLTIKDYESPEVYYIPTLRNAHSLFQQDGEYFSKIENDIFLDTFNRYYNFEGRDVQIFTGLHLYKEILNSRNAKRSIRQSFEKFEKFIGENFFGNKQVDIVAEFNKDDSLSGKNHSEIISVHIEGEKETRNLYELGDGIQAIVILMYKIFMAKDNSFMFIDEPELNLHPGMQRLFLEQISTNAYLKSKNLIYFISTHSNHLLDLTLEKENVSIYSFIGKFLEGEDKKFTVRNVNTGDNTVLKNLGVNNSSVFLANCSIWVEGISDRYYLKAFLNSYQRSLGKKSRSLKEDIDYAFFEYAGSNIDHYFFHANSQSDSEELISDINSLALNNRIFLLADSDIAKKTSKKGLRLVQLEEQRRDNFCPYIIWNIREVENLLTADLWNELLISICNKDLVKTDRELIQSKITSALNDIDLQTYKKEYIGVFLDEMSSRLGKIKGKKILNESSYAKIGDSFGTLTNKREMSEFLAEKNIDWEIFKRNIEIKNLTEALYDFIISSKS